MRLRLTLVLAGMAALLGLGSIAHAAGGMDGTYVATVKSPVQLKGKWALTLAKGGAYTVTWNGQFGARGKYTSTATTITFGRETGEGGCKGTGTYTWQRSGKTLRLTRKRESCQVRAAVLAHSLTRVR